METIGSLLGSIWGDTTLLILANIIRPLCYAAEAGTMLPKKYQKAIHRTFPDDSSDACTDHSPHHRGLGFRVYGLRCGLMVMLAIILHDRLTLFWFRYSRTHIQAQCGKTTRLLSQRRNSIPKSPNPKLLSPTAAFRTLSVSSLDPKKISSLNPKAPKPSRP